jgi:hypothetical protein
MTSTLKHTLDQVRDLQVSYIDTHRVIGKSSEWWPFEFKLDANGDPTTNDCLGFQLWTMGFRTRAQTDLKFTSIRAFRETFGWNTVSVADIRPGDMPLWNFNGGKSAEHVEFCYSIKPGSVITTTSANTGPEPGVLKPLGVYKKARPISGSLLGAIRPTYRNPVAVTTSASRARVRLIATYLNKHVAGPDTGAAKDGVPGPIYWYLVQTWGRAHGQYGPTFEIDGIPGPRSRAVEAKVYLLAKKS